MKIAITGTIGSGKSTFCDYIREFGYYVFDSDKYNSLLLQEGSPVFNKLISSFPLCFNNNVIDRKKMSELVFNNPNKRKELEDIMHPAIIDEIIDESKEHDIFFAEIPLLFETGCQKLFDKSILVLCDEEIAIKRLEERGFTPEKAKERIINQMPVPIKKDKADYLIYNNGNYVDLRNKAKEWLEEYVR